MSCKYRTPSKRDIGWNGLTPLRKVLARLYDDPRSIRRIVLDANLDLSKIDLGSTPLNNWQSVLEEAYKQELIHKLIRVVNDEYGNNKEFQRACTIYCQVKARPACKSRWH